MTKNIQIYVLTACLLSLSVPALAGETSAIKQTGSTVQPAAAVASVPRDTISTGSADKFDNAQVVRSTSFPGPYGTEPNRTLADSSAVTTTSSSPEKASLPKKVLGVAAAFLVGTPVCMVRRSKYENKYGIHGMIGDSDNKMSKFLAGTFWWPFAIVDGVVEAPFDAFANGLMYPAFSEDAMSKGKLIQNN